MRINPINATMFAGKQTIAKKAAAATFATAGTALAADTFVKGLSKPNKAIEGDDDIIRANDYGTTPCDLCCGDAIDQSAAREEWCCE